MSRIEEKSVLRAKMGEPGELALAVDDDKIETLIASGRADVLIAGGTDGGLALPGGLPDHDFVPALYYTSTAYGMVAPSNDPRRAMMPFDVKRSGIVVGEGSAMFVLERGDLYHRVDAAKAVDRRRDKRPAAFLVTDVGRVGEQALPGRIELRRGLA